MTTANASQTNKAMRGTKRVCQACQVRFYDLAREEIVCPACGVLYTPVAWHPSRSQARRGRFRQDRLAAEASSGPVLPEADLKLLLRRRPRSRSKPPATRALPLTPLRRHDIVLEQEPDDGDVSGLVDVDIEEPKER